MSRGGGWPAMESPGRLSRRRLLWLHLANKLGRGQASPRSSRKHQLWPQAVAVARCRQIIERPLGGGVGDVNKFKKVALLLTN